MTEVVPGYRWSADEFLRAWEAGVFDHRVELVNGEVWPVVIGDWHGDVTSAMNAMLRAPEVTVSSMTLASAGSLPDPDCWVRRRGAVPSASVGSRLSRWNPADVLLVVEVSDETILADLTTKTALYGSSGYAEYWVVTPESIYVHTQPTDVGYLARQEYRLGSTVPVPYADLHLDVAEVIALP